MAVALDQPTATISVDAKGAKPAIHVGTFSALLHCTKNANLAAADSVTGGKGSKGDMIVLTGKVHMTGDPTANADKITMSAWEFGFIQVADVIVYEFVHAGRMANEGSMTANLRSGFTKNPSFDGDSTLLQAVFDGGAVIVTPGKTANSGFDVQVKHGDHPTKLMDLTFTNLVTSSPNFIFSARRDEGFIAYFVARDPQGTIHFLSRVGWHLIWHGEFKWTAANRKPSVALKDSRIDVGQVLLGAPAQSDPSFAVAQNPSAPTANDQDATATNAAFGASRRSPPLTQSPGRPPNLPNDFFQ